MKTSLIESYKNDNIFEKCRFHKTWCKNQVYLRIHGRKSFTIITEKYPKYSILYFKKCKASLKNSVCILDDPNELFSKTLFLRVQLHPKKQKQTK